MFLNRFHINSKVNILIPNWKFKPKLINFSYDFMLIHDYVSAIPYITELHECEIKTIRQNKKCSLYTNIFARICPRGQRHTGLWLKGRSRTKHLLIKLRCRRTFFSEALFNTLVMISRLHWSICGKTLYWGTPENFKNTVSHTLFLILNFPVLSRKWVGFSFSMILAVF